MKKALQHRNWGVVVWILIFFLAVSFVTLLVYLTDTYFPDETLFILLSVLRYSSSVVCVCSVYKLLLSIYRLIREPSVPNTVKIFLYLASFGYGLAVVFFESFIVVLSGGNG